MDGVAGLARALLAGQPLRSGVVALLLLVSAVTETFSVALIIPLLHLAGLGHGGPSPVRDAVDGAAEALGLGLTGPVLLGAFVLLVALRSATGWQREMQAAALRLEFVDRRRERLSTVIAETAWPVLLRRRRSDLLHLLTHDVNRTGQGAMHIVQGSVAATFALAQIALAAAISPSVTFGMALGGGVLVAASRPLVRRSRTLGDQQTMDGRRTYAAMAELLGGLKLAKSESTEARHLRDITAAVARMRRRQLAVVRANAAARVVFDVGAAGMIAAIAWLAVGGAGLGTPELAVMAVIAARVLPRLRRFHQHVQQLAHALPAWLHLTATENELHAAAEPLTEPDAEPMRLGAELTVRGVSFSYADPSGAPLPLESVDLTIPAHQFVAVTGPSGGGKTTLADLLTGLLAPVAGVIEVDGVALTGSRRRRWRRSVACVPQDPQLFPETIRANLLRAAPEAPEEELWRALRLAAAADFVAALPEGLDTLAGDGGARLSGGQRQRIALARALLRRPALLVLDEATGQLDDAAERQVAASLRSLRTRMTIVAVSHRPALLAAADHTVLLEAGRIAGAGTRREPTPGPGSEDTRAVRGRPLRERP